jgi:DNA-binding NarL/FixJ family response regulator
MRGDGSPIAPEPPAGGMTGPRVLIADDQDLVRTGFRMILTARGITVVGEAADGAEAVAEARRLRPDVVLMDIHGPRTPAIHRDLTSLTPREVEVLALMGRGLSNSELAGALTLSEATVKTHVARIFAKLALRDRAQAVVLAYETGLVVPETTADEQPGQE